jgi:hypothetical protein
LEDVGGGHLVHDLGAAAARHVGLLDQEAVHGRGREPLVPEGERKVLELEEVLGEGARGLRARALAAVHVDGQAQHQPADAAPLDEREQGLGVLGEALAPADRLQGRGDREARVGEGEPDGLGPQIEAHQPRLGRQGFGQAQEGKDRHGRGA